MEGYAFALRPVELADAEFIAAMRSSDPQRVRYLHPISGDVQQQRDWLARYFERDRDYYWVIQRADTHGLEGLVGIYDLDAGERTAEWGRWVLKPESLGAVESALLVYRVAFELLGLDSLFCITVSNNNSVLSFHDSCGLRRMGMLKDRFLLADGKHDGVRHLCQRTEWPALNARLNPLAQSIARRLKHTK